jgi:hypothetical protein
MRTTLHTCTRVALLAGFFALTACNANQAPEPSDDSNGEANHSMLGGVVDKAMDEARAELKTSNISISENIEGLAKAEITPEGELLIDGRPVATTPAQKMLVMDYRTRLVDVAESGMDIGTQGADLASKAMGEAAKGIFSGKSEDEIEKSMEAETKAIEAAAARLCDRLPALLASERELAAAVPEFVPYATMDDGDIDDCKENGHTTPASQ